MTTHVALLRGINVGGRRRVGMEELRALFVSLGHEDVTTYLQSGNVVFGSSSGGARELAARIEARIAETLDLEVTVMLRTAGELARVVEGNPFLAGPADPASLHVTFLAREPDPIAVQRLEPARFAPDELVVAGREVYLNCPGGYGRTKLGNAFFERRLGVAATTRNWRTVTTLAGLARGR
jgi:uncharacterized protein (DUF1697 family)